MNRIGIVQKIISLAAALVVGIGSAACNGNVFSSLSSTKEKDLLLLLMADALRLSDIRVDRITASATPSLAGIGSSVTVRVYFTGPVTLTDGAIEVDLSMGRTVSITGLDPDQGTHPNAYRGIITVAEGDTTGGALLNATGIRLAGGTLTDEEERRVGLSLPADENNIAGTSSVRIDGIRPVIISFTTTRSAGTYGTGTAIDVTINFSENVNLAVGRLDVTLTSENGGTPVVIPITTISTQNSRTVTYTVASGDTTYGGDLDIVSVAETVGGSIQDLAYNPMNSFAIPGGQNLADTTPGIIVDGLNPTFISITSSSPDGRYGLGGTINLTVNFSENVTLAGGDLLVTLDTGAVVAIAPFANSATASATYTTGPGETTADLAAAGVALEGLATLKQAAMPENPVTLALPGDNFNGKTIAVDTTAPLISRVTSTTTNGTYGSGSNVNVTVDFSEAVTLAGGTLDVTLNTGAVVQIAAFTNASSASGTYTVAAGHTTSGADLTATGIALGGAATLRDTCAYSPNPMTDFSIAGGQNIADLKDIVIDGVAPTITSITSTTDNGTYGVGANVNVRINFSENVTLAGGTLNVTLNSGAVLNIPAFGPASQADYTYTVSTGHTTSGADLTVTGIVLSGGATLLDTATTNPNNANLALPVGNNLADTKDIKIDGVVPTISSITSTTVNGTYGVGANVNVRINFSENVTLADGTLDVTLNTGAILNIPAFGPASQVDYTYTVAAGHTTSGGNLNVTAVALGTGATIRDGGNNNVNLGLPVGNNLTDNKAIIIDGVVPAITQISSTTSNGTYGTGASINVRLTFNKNVILAGGTLDVTLNTGATVSIAAFGPALTTNGTYSVSAGHTTTGADLTVTGIALGSGATLRDATGNDAILDAPSGQNLADTKDIKIDAVAPYITSISSTTTNGTYGTNAAINISITFNRAVTLAGGTLDVTLNTGATVSIPAFGPSATASGTYTVASGHTTSGADLTVTGIALGSGAGIKDAYNNDANLSIPGGQNLADNKDIIIDAVIPVISSLSSTTSDGTYGAGSTVNVTITFSKAVALVGAGGMDLTLNSGATVNVPAFSSSATASVTYTVATGDSTSGADLTITNITLVGGATLRDSVQFSPNNASLALPSGNNLADNKDIIIDAVAPYIVSISSSTANATYGVGAAVNVTVTFSKSVALVGAAGMDLTLNSGATVNVPAFSSSATASVTYTVASGDTTSGGDLTVTTIALGSGSTLRDAQSNNADLTLPSGNNLSDNKDIKIDGVIPVISSITSTSLDGTYGIDGSVVIKLNFSKNVTLAGGTLDVTLNTGDTLNIAAFGPAATIEETYIVTTGDNTAPDRLTVTGVALGGVATLRDTVNNNADLGLPSGQNLADNKNIIIDGIRPLIGSVTSSTADGNYGVSSAINIRVDFTEAVSLSSGTLDVTLNTGATVQIPSFGSASFVTGTYTVAAGQSTADLTVTGIVASGGSVVDGASNAMTDYSIPAGENLGDHKDIAIDADPPVILSAETMDTNGNGRIDHYKITFNKNVNDSTFPGYAENSLGSAQAGWLVAGYSGVVLAHGSAAPEADTANDTVLYLEFTEVSSGYDTGVKPDLTTSATPGLLDTVTTNPNPLAPVGTTDLTETDGAAPAIVSASGITGTDLVSITFSEIVDANGSAGGCGSNLATTSFSYLDSSGGGASGISSMGSDASACDDRKVIVQLNTNLAIEDVGVDMIHAAADSIYDMADNIASPARQVALSGAISPYVIGVTATGARKIRITYSEAVDSSDGPEGARNLSNYTLIESPVESGCLGSGSDTINLTGTISEITPGTVFELSTDADQCSTTTYRLTVANVVDDNDDVVIADPKFGTFLGNERLRVSAASKLTLKTMVVTFNKDVEAGTGDGGAEEPTRYKFTGATNLGTITGAVRGAGGNANQVTLTHTIDQTGASYTVIASNGVDGDGFDDSAFGTIRNDGRSEALQNAPRDRAPWTGSGDAIELFDQGPIASDPFGDGSDFGYLASYAGRVYIGPNMMGNAANRMEADGSNPSNVYFAFSDEGDMENTATNIQSIGHTGCTVNSNNPTIGCGPDNEDGRGVFSIGSLGTPTTADYLFLGGARTTPDGSDYWFDYIYYTSDTDDTLDFKFIDLQNITGTATQGLSAITTLNSRIFAGMAKLNYHASVGRNAPDFGKVNFNSGSTEGDCTAGNDCNADDGTRGLRFMINRINYFGGTDSDACGGTHYNNWGYYVGVDSVYVFRGRIYAANGGYHRRDRNGGVIRSDGSNYANPGVCTRISTICACPDWAEITPRTATAWHNATSYNRYSIELTKPADLIPRDKAMAGFAEFNSNLYMTRNTCTVAEGANSQPTSASSISGCTNYGGDYTSNRRPQLWKCVPGTSGDVDECDAGDWSLVDGGDGFTNMGDTNNHSITMIVKNGAYLYVGFDNLVSGIKIYRTNTANPTEGDFTQIGTAGLGFPNDMKEIYSALSIQLGSDYYIYISAGKNSTPVSVYRQKN